MNKEGFGSQNSMALVESATEGGKDMQTTKCLITKLPLESAVRAFPAAFPNFCIVWRMNSDI